MAIVEPTAVWTVPVSLSDALAIYRKAMTQAAFVAMGHHEPEMAREALDERDAGLAYAKAVPWLHSDPEPFYRVTLPDGSTFRAADGRQRLTLPHARLYARCMLGTVSPW